MAGMDNWRYCTFGRLLFPGLRCCLCPGLFHWERQKPTVSMHRAPTNGILFKTPERGISPLTSTNAAIIRYYNKWIRNNPVLYGKIRTLPPIPDRLLPIRLTASDCQRLRCPVNIGGQARCLPTSRSIAAFPTGSNFIFWFSSRSDNDILPGSLWPPNPDKRDECRSAERFCVPNDKSKHAKPCQPP